MYGYPEQFIPDAELDGPVSPPSIRLGGRAPAAATSAEGAPE